MQGVDGEEGELTAGVSCKDLVQTVIRKTWSRERKWDPDRGPLTPWLKQVIKSEISHLVLSLPHYHEQAESDGSLLAASSHITGYSQDPVDVILRQESQEEIAKKLAPIYEAAGEVPELGEIVEAILDGCEPKPRYLAEVIGTTRADINNRLKRLRRQALRDTEKQ